MAGPAIRMQLRIEWTGRQIVATFNYASAPDGFEWDEAKRSDNQQKHGVDFAVVARFEFDTAIIRVDDRKNYDETRYLAFGKVDGRLHVLVFTARGAVIRVISLRRAILERLSAMARRKTQGVIEDENPEWTKEDFARARPASEVVPDIVAAYLRRRGKQRAPTKRLISLRLDPDVIEHFRTRGKGWQARINATLRKAAGI
jgi:uncharacterized DUF497 family protein/uncharacterized protein (DUF4415 family)